MLSLICATTKVLPISCITLIQSEQRNCDSYIKEPLILFMTHFSIFDKRIKSLSSYFLSLVLRVFKIKNEIKIKIEPMQNPEFLCYKRTVFLPLKLEIQIKIGISHN